MRVGTGRSIVMAAVLAASGVLAAVPSAANAMPAPVHSRAGVHVMPTVQAARAARRRTPALRTAAAQSQLRSKGGPVVTGPPRVYLVFWGSQWYSGGDPLNAQNQLFQLFQGIGRGNESWSGVMTQYCQGVSSGTVICPANANHVGYATGGALAGTMVDNVAPAPDRPSAADIGREAIRAAAFFGNTAPGSNNNAQYIVVSPHGTHPDGFNTPTSGFCAWHGATGAFNLPSPSGSISFTNMPYVSDAGTGCGNNLVNPGPAGLLDGFTMVAGHEYAETITDPFPASGWVDANGQENADKCIWIPPTQPGGSNNIAFFNGTFAMQTTWSNNDAACKMFGPTITDANSAFRYSTAMIIDDVLGSSTTFIASGSTLSSNRPWQIAANSTPGCTNLGASPYGYLLTCPGVTSFTLNLHDGADTVGGTVSGALTVNSDSGNKNVKAGSTTSIVTLNGGTGNDWLEITASSGPIGGTTSTAHGNGGNDVLIDSAHVRDSLYGGGGSDWILDKDGRTDNIYCGGADGAQDVVLRDAGQDVLNGCNGNDAIFS